MKTKLNDIKIIRTFKNTHPNPEKLLKCMTYYAKHRKLDRDIVLTKDNVLVDGYVGYLTLVALGIKKYKCINDNNYQWFVKGKHNNNPAKTYTWRIPEWLMIDGLPYINKGKTYRVQTSRGESAIKVTKVFVSNKSPVDVKILDFLLV